MAVTKHNGEPDHRAARLLINDPSSVSQQFSDQVKYRMCSTSRG